MIKYSTKEIQSILKDDYIKNGIHKVVIYDKDNQAYESGLAQYLFENYDYINIPNGAKFYLKYPLKSK